jgi:hypothetical protein
MKKNNHHEKEFRHLKPGILCVVLACLYLPSFGQLNCTTKQTQDSIVTTCFHRNHNPSTIERWNSAKTWGNMTGYDSRGKQIFHHDLRRFAGHASVYLQYHPNGQVRKAEYSSAPDGGIQFYRIIQEFNEQGEQTAYHDFSQPDGRPVLRLPTQMPEDPPMVPEVVAPQPAETIQCATPYVTVFTISNETRRKLTVSLSPKPSQWASLRPHPEIEIKAKTTLVVDSLYLAERFLDAHETYTLEITGRRKKKTRIIEAIPAQEATRRVFVWHLIEK